MIRKTFEHMITEPRHLLRADAGGFVSVDSLSCILIGKLLAEVTGETSRFLGGRIGQRNTKHPLRGRRQFQNANPLRQFLQA